MPRASDSKEDRAMSSSGTRQPEEDGVIHKHCHWIAPSLFHCAEFQFRLGVSATPLKTIPASGLKGERPFRVSLGPEPIIKVIAGRPRHAQDKL